MTTRDDVLTIVHQAIIDAGLATTINQAVRVRLLNLVMKRIIAGDQKWKLVDMLNKEARKLGPDVHEEAVAVYDMIKDVDL